jgi:2TM domain
MTEMGERREAAIKRLRAKRGFNVHFAIFVVINILLLVIWALSGAGYFLADLGVAGLGNRLGFHGWAVYFRQPMKTRSAARASETTRRPPLTQP